MGRATQLFPRESQSSWEGKIPRFSHLIQHSVALGPLPLPQENQPRDDVGGDDVQVSEKFCKKVGDLGVGVLKNPGRRGVGGRGGVWVWEASTQDTK